MNVAMIGAGYVGLVTGLCLADRGHHVHCVDVDAAKIARLTKGELPIHEAGLDELFQRHLGTRFFPSSDVEAAVVQADVTIIAVGTPFENGAISLRYVGEAAATIGRALALKSDYHVVVVKSTVVPGTTDEFVRPILERASGKRSGTDFGLGMNPEFLREGEAVEDFLSPDRIVLGALDDRSLGVMARLYADFHGIDFVRTNTKTAEMIKYASNALLATLISFSNEIANLCSVAPDVDVVDVLNAVHLDKRLTFAAPDGTRVVPPITSYLKAGCGFGGSCFPKDLRALIRWGEENNCPVDLLSAVMSINERRPVEVLRLLKKHLPALEDVRIAVLGLAFKPGTDDIRESPALRLIRDLRAEGARVVAYDPVAIPATRQALPHHDVAYAQSLREAVDGSAAVVLITAWPEFRELPQLLQGLETPPLVIDGRRALDKRQMRRYEGIGLSGTPAVQSTR
jgi:UDPglucose 6-dehydrogenase